tara:strand:+ start:74 stop:322 length:249 start_codon:yes stop_codon:yes gene_type:complete
MRIVITDRYSSWWFKRLSLLPSLDFEYATGLIDNLEKGIVQRSLEINVHFSFLFFNASIETLSMWGNEGKVINKVENERFYI